MRDQSAVFSYEQWLQEAAEFDAEHSLDKWREEVQSPFYPYELLQEQISQIRRYRNDHQVKALIDYMQEAMYRTLHELSDDHLYNVARSGTKYLVEEYIDEIVTTLDYLCDNQLDGINPEQKLTLFRHARKNFGCTGLMLSGGGAFGIYHLGIIKCLVEHQLLPKVIAGTSMGAIVAGFAGTHTDAEISEILQDPAKRHFQPIKLKKLSEIFSTGSILDEKQLEACILANTSEETFLEAYQRTGRAINITISPTRAGQKPRILNYKTVPNALIAHGIKASCSIPFLFPTTTLAAKGNNNERVPYMASEEWADGGVSGDIPMARVGRQHNVNHFIVSQTNPHVLPFVTSLDKPGFLRYVVDLASSSVRAQWHQFIRVSKKRIQHRGMRFWMDRADAFLGQEYLGDINLHPDFPLSRYLKVLKNPNEEEINEFVLAGERATWPKLSKIRNQTRISRTLEACNQRLLRQIKTASTGT